MMWPCLMINSNAFIIIRIWLILSKSLRIENRVPSSKPQVGVLCSGHGSDLHHSEDVNYLFLVSLADSSHGLCNEGGELRRMTTLSTWCHAPDNPEIKDSLRENTAQQNMSSKKYCQWWWGSLCLILREKLLTIKQYNLISMEDDIFLLDISWCAMFWSLQSVE